MNASTVLQFAPQPSHSPPLQPASFTTPSHLLHLDRACQAEAARAELPGHYTSLTSLPYHTLTRILQQQHSEEIPVINSRVCASINSLDGYMHSY